MESGKPIISAEPRGHEKRERKKGRGRKRERRRTQLLNVPLVKMHNERCGPSTFAAARFVAMAIVAPMLKSMTESSGS